MSYDTRAKLQYSPQKSFHSAVERENLGGAADMCGFTFVLLFLMIAQHGTLMPSRCPRQGLRECQPS